MSKPTSTETVTMADIRALRSEAASAGDTKQVKLCDRALRGKYAALEACCRVIRDARAQHAA